MHTQIYVPQAASASLVILENNTVRVCGLDERSAWTIGRYAPGVVHMPDIPLNSGIVSREHGCIQKIDGQWYYVDNPQNLNGTFCNGQKIPRPANGMRYPVPLSNGDLLRIDNENLDRACSQGVLMLFTTAPVRGSWYALPLQGKTTLIGRDPSCDVLVPLPYISAKHAKITCRSDGYYLSDCSSSAGTFLNGQRVSKETLLREKDYISLCDCSYFFMGGKLLYPKRDRQQENVVLSRTSVSQRPVALKADIRTKRVKDHSGSGMKELIRDIHLEIRQGTLVALLGTAGAGKSTVMNCLNGMDLEGVEGTVYYQGVDLMKNFEQMKFLIGSVPQKKIFHKTFTPEQEFRLAAKKRLPADTTKQEIEERVDKTLEMLSMTGVRKSRNSKLSGGEQTRVNVGIELVADRDLLCLDEPDQGLSPNYKHELFEIMRNLAHKNGKSVLSIIHDVSEIDLFDQVVMLAKVDGVGRLAFSGTPEEARRFFGTDIQNAYELLEKDPKRFVR